MNKKVKPFTLLLALLLFTLPMSAKSKKKDKGFQGASALLCKFKREGKWVEAELDYLLHIPKGKTEFEIY